MPEGADASLLGAIAMQESTSLIHICLDDKRLATLSACINFFYPTVKIIELPAWDCLPYDRVSPNIHIASKRTEALCEIASLKEDTKQKTIVLTTINSLLQRIPQKELFKRTFFKAKEGDKINRDDLIQYLLRCGYINSPTANDMGEFALRGSIIDIIPSNNNDGLRLDFFGNTLERIRNFDPLTQVSSGRRDFIQFTPASELMLDEDTIECFRNRYRELFGTVTSSDPLYEAISEKRHYPGMEHWLPLFYPNMETLFDYLPNASFSFDHLAMEAAFERLEIVHDYYHSRKENAEQNKDGGSYKPIPPKLLYLVGDELKNKLHNKKQIFISPYTSDNTVAHEEKITFLNLPYHKAPDFQLLAKTAHIANNNAPKSHNNPIEILKDYCLKDLSKNIIIACYSEGSRARLQHMLLEHEVTTELCDDYKTSAKNKKGIIKLVILELEHGFEVIIPETKIDAQLHQIFPADFFVPYAFLTEQDILGERISIRRSSKKRSDRVITEAASLTEGQLVVHKEHGIGRFERLETIRVSGEGHDCLLIIYDGGDKLYVPVENIDSISRYGSDTEDAKLDRLGSSAWQERKSRMKKRIKMMADELLKIAAERLLKKAPILHPVEGIYEEFCARFPYVETEDQMRAIEEVAEDLNSGKPMDRLVCGDVGFGKTEVALRAAFIAASDGRQVAIISPTTLLCRQHIKTFKARFAGFPFEVRGLSRLTHAGDARRTKKGLEEGTVDIVIGTHALLAKNIKFKNLGLVIVDEEQLFGVKQKERLKQFKSDVHMLTLSATPIPRTLQMSLTGIKDLSLIATPPVDRLAIRSFTMPYDSVVIRSAIMREHYRGGQVFYVAPRVSDLSDIVEKLKILVPEIKIATAHGQMLPDDLDNVMNEFYDGKYDLLVSTNIIGSGIDLPTANTIIVHRADMFGLAQLYQMRGRVGRGKIRAYAYFTTPPKRMPSRMAVQRLEVIQNLDSLGAGFSLASHDMDIRGFGNMLGEEQSGQIKEVGVELYQEMLREAVENAKSIHSEEVVEDKFSPQINLGISVLLPEEYIQNIELRLGMYRRLANAETAEELESLAAELIDRFGPLPDEAKNLFEVMKIKQQCVLAGINKLDAGPKGIVISFHNNNFKNPEALIKFISKNPLRTKIRSDQKIIFTAEYNTSTDRIKAVRNSLEQIITLAA